MKLMRDTWLIFQRQALLLLRNPVWILVGVFQPVMYLLLFVSMHWIGKRVAVHGADA